MRISFFNYHWDVEGGARGAAAQLRSIAGQLERRGHQVDLHFRAARQYGAMERSSPLRKVDLLRRFGHVPKLLLRNFRFIARERKLFEEFKPDVVLAVSSFCNFSALSAARMSRIPFVLFAEAPLQYEYQMFFRQYHSYPWITRWIEGLNVRRADRVICVTESLKGYLMRYGAPATKIHVIPNGVDPDRFKPEAPDKEILERHGLEGKVVVGFVGSFNFFTDVERFAYFIRTMCEQQENIVFLFVGKGEAGDRLARVLSERGLSRKAVFTGAVPHADVPRYLSAMDITIAPYRGDYFFYGSALKPLEYMAAGKATVVSKLGQCRELISDGYNGMLFEWDDLSEMGYKVLELARNPELRCSIGANARRTIERDWTWDIQVARCEDVLQAAIEARSAGAPTQ